MLLCVCARLVKFSLSSTVNHSFSHSLAHTQKHSIETKGLTASPPSVSLRQNKWSTEAMSQGTILNQTGLITLRAGIVA